MPKASAVLCVQIINNQADKTGVIRTTQTGEKTASLVCCQFCVCKIIKRTVFKTIAIPLFFECVFCQGLKRDQILIQGCRQLHLLTQLFLLVIEGKIQVADNIFERGIGIVLIRLEGISVFQFTKTGRVAVFFHPCIYHLLAFG